MERDDRRDRLLAEMAAGPRVDGDSVSGSLAGGESVVGEVIGVRDRVGEAGGGADHRGVVGAERGGTSLSWTPRSSQSAGDRLAQGAVGGDAAAERDRRPLPPLQRPLELRDQLADRGRLEARREVGAALLDPLRAEVAAEVDERRLQPAEAEVEAGVAAHRDRKIEGLGVAVGGQRSSAGPPG